MTILCWNVLRFILYFTGNNWHQLNLQLLFISTFINPEILISEKALHEHTLHEYPLFPIIREHPVKHSLTSCEFNIATPLSATYTGICVEVKRCVSSVPVDDPASQMNPISTEILAVWWALVRVGHTAAFPTFLFLTKTFAKFVVPTNSCIVH